VSDGQVHCIAHSMISLPLREKLRRATTNDLWPDSAIVEVALDCGGAVEATTTPGDGA
jgi:hypothetical protein